MLQEAQTKGMLVIRPINGAKQEAGGFKKLRANEYSDFPCAVLQLQMLRAVPATSLDCVEQHDSLPIGWRQNKTKRNYSIGSSKDLIKK